MNLNKVMLIGRTGKDPEINYVKEDLPLARFSIATNESYKTKEGDWRDITEWHNILAWRHLAKLCENNVKKGMLIYVEGKLQTRQWEGQDGNKRYTTEVVADSIKILEKKQDGGVPLPNSEFPNKSENTKKSPENEDAVNDKEAFFDPDNFSDNDNGKDDLPF